jgi:hypothetical protein
MKTMQLMAIAWACAVSFLPVVLKKILTGIKKQI